MYVCRINTRDIYHTKKKLKSFDTVATSFEILNQKKKTSFEITERNRKTSTTCLKIRVKVTDNDLVHCCILVFMFHLILLFLILIYFFPYFLPENKENYWCFLFLYKLNCFVCCVSMHVQSYILVQYRSFLLITYVDWVKFHNG